MQILSFKFRLALVVIGLLIFQSALTSDVGARPQKRKAKSSDTSLVWGNPRPIQRPATVPGPKPRPRIVRAPLLTVEWRMLGVQCKTGPTEEVNPLAVFHTDDRFRIAIKTNQRGYLYVLNQTENETGKVIDGPRLIYPDSQNRNARNYVEKDEEHILPVSCPSSKDQCDCQYFYFTEVPGREVFIVLFSRELLTDLSENLLPKGDEMLVRPEYIEELKTKFRNASARKTIRRTSKPNISPQLGGGAGRYVLWVTNYDLKNNEELIEIISLNHVGDKSRN